MRNDFLHHEQWMKATFIHTGNSQWSVQDSPKPNSTGLLNFSDLAEMYLLLCQEYLKTLMYRGEDNWLWVKNCSLTMLLRKCKLTSWFIKIALPESRGWIFPVVSVGIILRLMSLLSGFASATTAGQWPLHESLSIILVGPAFGQIYFLQPIFF